MSPAGRARSLGWGRAVATSLLTDHYELTMLQGALRSGTAGRRVVFELFARSLPGGRRYGVVAGTGRFLDAPGRLPLRPRRAGLAARGRGGRRRHARVAGGVPLRRRRLGLPGGRGVLPRLARADRRGDVRRGGAAGDAGAERAQPRLGHRLGGIADDLGGRRPAVHRDGLAAYPRGRRPSPARGRRTSPASPARRTCWPASAGGSRPAAPARTRSCCCTTASAPPSPRRSTRWATPPPCWSTPTTCPPRSAPPSRWPDPRSAPCASTPATSRTLAVQVRAELDELGAKTTRIIVTGDLDEHAIAALAASPVDGYGVGTALVTGLGASDQRLRLQAGRALRRRRRALVPVAKNSPLKQTVGGRKWAGRRVGADGTAQAEVIAVGGPPPTAARCRCRWCAPASGCGTSP